MIKILLNVGCGQTRPKGWVNCDSSLNANLQRLWLTRILMTSVFGKKKYENQNLIYMNLNEKWPYKNNEIDVVYASHVLEHLTRKSANLFFLEANRVLKNNGVLRIVVPDMKKLAINYIEANNFGNSNAIIDLLKIVNMNYDNAYGGQFNIIEKIIHCCQGYPHTHKYMYDSLSLIEIFKKFGFMEPIQSSYGKSNIIDQIKEIEFTSEGVPAIYIESKKIITKTV